MRKIAREQTRATIAMLLLALVLLAQHVGVADRYLASGLKGSTAVYGILTLVCVMLFVMNQMFLLFLALVRGEERLALLRASKSYPQIPPRIKAASRWLALTALVSFLTMIVDPSTLLGGGLRTLLLPGLAMSGYYIEQSVWIIVNLAGIIIKERAVPE